MTYSRFRSELPVLVKNGSDPNVERELADAYSGTFSFLPGYRGLARLARDINRALSRRDSKGRRIYDGNPPGIESITRASNGLEPVSLDLLCRLDAACRAIVDNRDRPRLAQLASQISDQVGTGLGPSSVVVCLHSLNTETMKEFREKAAKQDPALSDRTNFSSALLADSPWREETCRRYLISYLEDGYGNGAGTYKVSNTTAEELHKCCAGMAKRLGTPAPTLNELFSFGAKEGARRGHSSRALGVRNGNLIH